MISPKVYDLPDGTLMPWPRALPTSQPITSTDTNLSSSSSHSSTTSTFTRSTTTTRPFFQDPSSVTPVPSSDPDRGAPLPKVVLEYVLIAAFVMICAGLLLHRIIFRRRHSTSLWPAFRHTSADPPITPHRFPRTTGFTEVPPYPYARRTRAIDTDAAGRRIGAGIETSDHDGYIGDKDVLPAYDTTGGPPKYRELAYELDVMPSHNVFPINGAESADMRNPADSEPDIPEAHSPRPLSGYVGGNAATISAAPAAPAAAHVRQ